MHAGYLHPDYAASLSGFGTPRSLAGCGGWIIQRPIPNSASSDGMGCYPLFCCVDWRALAHDVSGLEDSLVSLVIVADPLGAHSVPLLSSTFDSVAAFKDHFVIETGRPLSAFVSRSHRAHAHRALKRVDVELCAEPSAFLDEWERLYGVLAARHAIAGLRRFSRTAFAQQLAVPGLVMFRASTCGQTIGLDLWYEQDGNVQNHLTAVDENGYALRASYALKWRALEFFADRARWINLGGESGAGSGAGSGLTAFKRGWSTGRKTAWLCRRVLQPAVYSELVRARGAAAEDYFPAYRRGEFG
jgi:hypothetical protein